MDFDDATTRVSASLRLCVMLERASEEGVRRAAIVASEAGLLGHMAVFGLVGFFLTRAAIEYDPDEPESLDQAVRALAETSFGTSALLALAVGMVAYAAFSFVEARWRVLVR